MATSPLANPGSSISAYQEASQPIQRRHLFEPPRPIRTIAELRKLWELDTEAYQECAIPFEVFRRWWQRYPHGNTVIFEGDRIIASIGKWALTPEQYEQLSSGAIAESDLQPMPLSRFEKHCTNGASRIQRHTHWYLSGIVLAEEYRGRVRNNPIVPLLEYAIPSWVESNRVAFPLQVAALGEYVEGINLLEGFGFEQRRDRSEMPDGCGLYELTIDSEERAQSLLKARNLR